MPGTGKGVVKILPSKFRTLYFLNTAGEIFHFLGILSVKKRPSVTRGERERGGGTGGDLLATVCAHSRYSLATAL